jgi:hypothetical protein
MYFRFLKHVGQFPFLMAATPEEMRASRIRALDGATSSVQAPIPGMSTENSGGIDVVDAAPSAAAAAAAAATEIADDCLTELQLEDVRTLLWSADAPGDDRARWHRQGFVLCDGTSGTNQCQSERGANLYFDLLPPSFSRVGSILLQGNRNLSFDRLDLLSRSFRSPSPSRVLIDPKCVCCHARSPLRSPPRGRWPVRRLGSRAGGIAPLPPLRGERGRARWRHLLGGHRP